jgi:hypothetical protein
MSGGKADPFLELDAWLKAGFADDADPVSQEEAEEELRALIKEIDELERLNGGPVELPSDALARCLPTRGNG